MLLGREREIRSISDLIENGRQGRSGALVISGEPGIGKTALLRQAASLAEDALILSTVGIEGEAEIPYANLADIVRPVIQDLALIPARQAAALNSVLALGPAQPSDRFVVAAATLSLLSAVAARHPVVVLIDDIHWVDTSTREALTFVAHRVQAEGIVFIMASREEQLATLALNRFPILTLAGLHDTECQQLLASATDALPHPIVARLVDETAGNPLALIGLTDLLTPDQLVEWVQRHQPLPIAAAVEDAFGASVRRLSAKAQSALCLLSILGASSVDVLEQVMLTEGLTLDDLTEALRARLITLEQHVPAFRHPLVRSAVYQTSPVGLRRRAHLAAARILATSQQATDTERRAWHLIAAGETVDENLAATLAAASLKQLTAHNFATAGRLAEQSSRLTPPGPTQAARLVQAAHGFRLAGSIDQSRTAIDEARILVTADPAGRRTEAEISYMACRLDMWTGDVTGGRDRLLHLVRSRAEVEPGLAAYMLADIALVSVELGQFGTADAAARNALASARSAGTPSLLVLAVRALVDGLRGEPGALNALAARTAEVDRFDPLTIDSTEQILLVVGLARLAAEDVDGARVVLTRAVLEARHHSALGMLPFRLGRLAWAYLWCGDWSESLAASAESLALAADTGWQSEQPNSLIAAARVEALTGRAVDCQTHLATAKAIAAATGTRSYEAMADAVTGSLAFCDNNYLLAIEHLTAVQEFAEANNTVDNPMLWWTGDLVESLVLSDRRDEAVRLLRRLQSLPSLPERPVLAAVTARCSALVEPDRFEYWIAEAMTWHHRSANPFEQARTALLLGRYLRRQRRPEARNELTRTLATFERLGAGAWAARARGELRAAGVRVSRPGVGLDDLTAQELQVVLAVSRGLSNKEVAAQLFLSVKTVEYHLNKAFAKLGVRRRSQLGLRLAASESNRDQGPD